MVTRKNVLVSFLSTLALGIAVRGTARASVTTAQTPTPKPTPSGIQKPSELARQLALWIQRSLSKAHLSDTMVEKIAEDIQGNFPISSDMVAAHRDNLPPPDFVFAASSRYRP
jgi:hypothetical protein